jgi:hypothetical protein
VKNVGILKIELNRMAKDFKLNILNFFFQKEIWLRNGKISTIENANLLVACSLKKKSRFNII